jgi:hypothetical protein
VVNVVSSMDADVLKKGTRAQAPKSVPSSSSHGSDDEESSKSPFPPMIARPALWHVIVTVTFIVLTVLALTVGKKWTLENLHLSSADIYRFG